MVMRRSLGLFLAMVLLLLSGCGNPAVMRDIDNGAQTLSEPDISVYMVDYPYTESELYQTYPWEFEGSDTYFNPVLQKRVMELAFVPADGEETFSQYCLELYGILTELGMIETDSPVILADYDKDDIACINFVTRPVEYHGAMVTLLISGRDGHIIHLGLVGKAKYQGRRVPDSEPLFMPFAWDDTMCQDFWGRTVDDVYDELDTFDPKLQTKIDALALYLPLNTPERVACYGEQIQSLLTAYGYIEPGDKAVFYMEHPNHMISICYNPSLGSKDGGIYVIVDSLSGRIAWLCEDFGNPIQARGQGR